MDGHRFDRLTRTFATTSRRSLIKTSFAGAVAMVLGTFGGDRAEAAVHPCVKVKRGVTTPVPDGTRCGKCGVCFDSHCVRDSAACEPCGFCETTTMTCEVSSSLEGGSCGTCGTCTGAKCKKNGDACKKCERCQRMPNGTYNCISRCPRGEKCCPTGECVAQDKCCPGEHRCRDNTCCLDDCCGGTCCDPSSQQCCGGSCCPSSAICVIDQFCCEGDPCPLPGTNQIGCCTGGSICCHNTGACATSLEQCCLACDPCQTCDTEDGSCIDDNSKNGQHCETASTGKCGGTCKNGHCEKVTIGQTCSDNHACCNEGCCELATQSCCGGACCDREHCCGDECCDGTCVLGVCCPINFFSAAEIDETAIAAGAPVCCPYGPPCGGRCCNQGDTCCGGTCCPAGNFCCDGVCQTLECGCPNGGLDCDGIGCCPPGQFCSSDGCCPITTAVVCGAAIPSSDSSFPCCPFDTESCEANIEGTDWWCCPKGQAGYDGGCCPADKPFFTAIGCSGSGINGTYCCDDGTTGDLCDDFAAHCTDQPLPGRR